MRESPFEIPTPSTWRYRRGETDLPEKQYERTHPSIYVLRSQIQGLRVDDNGFQLILIMHGGAVIGLPKRGAHDLEEVRDLIWPPQAAAYDPHPYRDDRLGIG